MEKITGIKLDRFPLRDLRKIADLIYFDGPLLSYFEDDCQNTYLYYWCDVGEEYNRWLVFRVADQHLKLYLAKRISLYSLITNPIDGFLYSVDIDTEFRYTNTHLLEPRSLPASYLPELDSYYEFEPIPINGQKEWFQTSYLSRTRKFQGKDNLRLESLDWSLTHILNFGDTDIFPVPFEFNTLKHSWDEIRYELSTIDIATYEPYASRRLPVLKPETGYRVATQLDPVDTLIYTALVYDIAELIENYRIPKEQKVACSYRIQTNSEGRLFASTDGWNDFQSKTLEILDKSNKYDYIVVADIADFYNQISHEGLETILGQAGVSPDRAKNIRTFLNKINLGSSKGIPVGPYASIILAEACLNDVDLFLLRKGYVHTRYVDDIRIFCSDFSEAQRVLHDLSEYLHIRHRLALQPSKTKLPRVKDFLEKDLYRQLHSKEHQKTEQINEILLMLSTYNDSETTEDEPSRLKLQAQIKENIDILFDISLEEDTLQLGLSRYLLRRASMLDTNILHDRVLKNLDRLAPAIRDVAQYLLATTHDTESIVQVDESLIDFIETSDLGFMRYLLLWTTHILTEKMHSTFKKQVGEICANAYEQLGSRPLALFAHKVNSSSWARKQMRNWQSNPAWDRRAIIWAGKTLSRRERKSWLDEIQTTGDILDRAVARAALNGSEV